MSLFLLGIVAGLSISSLVIVTLVFFRRTIEHKTMVMGKLIENAGPRPKGAIYIPDDEADEVRAEIIAKNRERRNDTPFSELR